jgi:hypothetical protein
VTLQLAIDRIFDMLAHQLEECRGLGGLLGSISNKSAAAGGAGSTFEPVSMRTQLVAGTNYYVKVSSKSTAARCMCMQPHSRNVAAIGERAHLV